MAINFPNSPTNGQVFTDPNGTKWTYESATKSWTAEGAGHIHKPEDVLSVKDFGAIGDGVVDDTDSVKAAFAAAAAATPRRAVFFPSGNYKITDTVDVGDCSFYGEARNSSKILCAVPDGTITFTGLGVSCSVVDLGFYGSGVGATPDGIKFNGYKNCFQRLFFQNMGACLCPERVIVTSVINQCEFLACSSAVNDKFHDGSSAHTTLYFTDNNVLYGSHGFYMKTEAHGFLIEGNVFEDMAVVYHGSGKLVYQFLFSTNWFEQVYKDLTIFSNIFAGATLTSINNSFRSGSKNIIDAHKLQGGQRPTTDLSGGGGGIRIETDSIRVSDSNGSSGVVLTNNSLLPAAAQANFTDTPSTFTFATQNANTNKTTKGTDLTINLGTGSNGQRGGVIWGLPQNDGPQYLLGQSSLSGNGYKDAVIIGATSNYWGRTDDIARVSASLNFGAFYSTGGDGRATGVLKLVAGQVYNNRILETAAKEIIFYGSALHPAPDNAITLGTASDRWSTVYAATGTINTSDRNLKQDIEDLSAAELQVAKAIKGLIKKYHFIDAVKEKADKARIHVGVIAQDVEQAFTAAGLDPTRYALFCRDVWWELDGVEVEADDSGVVTTKKYQIDGKDVPLNEDGSKPDGAVEVVETQQATKHERLGVRYEELLAFVISSL